MKLIASKAMKYKTRRLQAGDEFETTDRLARIFVGGRLASYAPEDEPKPAAAKPAPVAEHKPAPEPARPDIDELRAEAEALGIDVDGRWGVMRLQQEIAQAKL